MYCLRSALAAGDWRSSSGTNSMMLLRSLAGCFGAGRQVCLDPRQASAAGVERSPFDALDHDHFELGKALVDLADNRRRFRLEMQPVDAAVFRIAPALHEPPRLQPVDQAADGDGLDFDDGSQL